MKKPLLVVFISSAVATCLAQDIEVRRALPVGTPSMDDYPNPAWINRVVPEPEVRRALPVGNITVNPTPEPTPTAPETKPVVTPIVDDPSNIRIAPSSPANPSALDRANNFYSRKMYDVAIPEYEKFLVSSTDATGRDGALFRLAESHRMAGNAAAARAGYEKLLMEFKSGEFAASGAYRLGEILLAEKRFEPAAIQFDLASREAREAEVRLSAAYFAACSLDAQKKDEMAEERYRAVLAASGKNPYYDNAAMALAGIQGRNGKKQAALESYEELISKATAPDVACSAALQAAFLARELGLSDQAIRHYDKAASLSQDAKTKSDAMLAALRLRYESGDFSGITSKGEGIAGQLPLESRAEFLTILGAAFRKTGKEAEARKVYDRLVKEFPETATSAETLYQRLLTLSATKDKSLPAEVDAFLKKSTEPRQNAFALLLKAESLFEQGNYADAARVYGSLGQNEFLNKEQRVASLYKNAWCLAASGDPAGAIAAYAVFLDKFPNDELSSTAVLQRGLANQKIQKFEEAIRDFELIISKYPYSKEVELALLQKALTCGQQKNYAVMTQAFQELLQKFPNTAAAAQAYFWLGWAAFENKDYSQAIPYLDKARVLDAKNYQERSSLRILLAHYQLQNRAEALRESQACKQIPGDVAIWLAQGCMDDKKPAQAEKLLLPLASGNSTEPVAWILLSESQLALEKFKEAKASGEKFISLTDEAPMRSRGFVAKAKASLGLKQNAEARHSAEQAMQLQPEGQLNADARMVLGEVFFLEADYDSSARAFMTVAVLTDDPVLTPKALKRASESYRRIQKDAEADKALKEIRDRFPSSGLNAGI